MWQSILLGQQGSENMPDLPEGQEAAVGLIGVREWGGGMSDDRVYIGMFRPTLGEVCKSIGYYDPDAVDMQGRSTRGLWERGHFDKPVYATRDEIIEKMAKLELEKRESAQ